MSGKWVRGGQQPKPRPGKILEVRPYDLHGTLYYAVLFRFDEDPADAARQARVSHDIIFDTPRAGDRVLIESVLGVVYRMARAEGETGDAAPRNQTP